MYTPEHEEPDRWFFLCELGKYNIYAAHEAYDQGVDLYITEGDVIVEVLANFILMCKSGVEFWRRGNIIAFHTYGDGEATAIVSLKVTKEAIITAAKTNDHKYLDFVSCFKEPVFSYLEPIVLSLERENLLFFEKFARVFKIPDSFMILIASRFGLTHIVERIFKKHPSYVNICFEPEMQQATEIIRYDDILFMMKDGENTDTDSRCYLDDFTFLTRIIYTVAVRPIHLACISGNLDTVKLLVESGADINEHADNDEGSIGAGQFCFVEKDNREIFYYLCEKDCCMTLPGEHKFCSEEAEKLYYRLYDICYDCEYDEKDYHEFEDDKDPMIDIFKQLVEEKGKDKIVYRIFKYGNVSCYPLIADYKVEKDQLGAIFFNIHTDDLEKIRPRFFKHVKV